MRKRLDANRHLGKQRLAALLAVAGADDFGRVLDRFAIADPRLVDAHVQVEIAQQPVLDDFQVQLAHAADQRLAGFLVFLARKVGSCRFIISSTSASFLRSVERLRLDRHRDDRLGKLDRFQQDRMLRIAQRVAGDRVPQADDADDVAGDRRWAPARGGRPECARVAARFPSCPCPGCSTRLLAFSSPE